MFSAPLMGEDEGGGEKYVRIRPNLANLLKKADGRVPVEFIHVYKKQLKQSPMPGH